MESSDLYRSQKEYYRDKYNESDDVPWNDAFDDRWLEDTARGIRRSGACNALEIGTGHGRGARILAEAGFMVVGVDYLYEPLVVAKKYKNGHARPHYLQADIFSAPFAKNRFDVVLDWGVFHHILRSDTRLFLNHILRLLKNEGHYLLGCFSINFKHHESEKRKRNWIRHHGHYDRFSTKEELMKIFAPAFEINSLTEDPKGFYLLDMTKRNLKP